MRPSDEAPNLPDGTLDQIVSSINVEREQIGPNRYIADLGVQFDRAKAAPFLGVAGGVVERSVPMLLIPVIVSGGTATSVEQRNAWQRAWAQFRTSQSPIDYVRVSGMGADPLLINAAQTESAGSWMVAQPSRNVRGDRYPGRRSSAPAALSRRTGARPLHRPPWARQ